MTRVSFKITESIKAVAPTWSLASGLMRRKEQLHIFELAIPDAVNNLLFRVGNLLALQFALRTIATLAASLQQS